MGHIEEFRVRIGFSSKGIEQFGHVQTTEHSSQASANTEPVLEGRLREQIEPIGHPAQDEYLTGRKQVKAAIEGTLGSPRPFGQGPQLAKLAAAERDDAARFTKRDCAEDDRERLLSGHWGLAFAGGGAGPAGRQRPSRSAPACASCAARPVCRQLPRRGAAGRG